MSKSWNTTETWVGLIVLGVGGLLVAIGGMWVYVSATTTPIHPEPQNVASMAQSAPPVEWADAVTRAREAARAGLVEQNLPGLSVAVGTGGQVIWAEGFGWAHIENKTPVTPETRFKIGTASKMLTSAAVGLLVEKRQLDLDGEIQAYVPQYPKKQWPVTVRQLMGHVGGVRRDEGDEEPVREHCKDTLGALDRFADADLRFQPGTEYFYSSYGWILVSGAVEAAAGEPFLDFMRTQVFEPLGMKGTRADPGARPLDDFASYYFPRFGGDPRYGPQELEDTDFSCFSGSSAFLSTPSDMVRFITAINGGKLLQPATVQALQTPLRLPSGQDTGYGLGWDIEDITLAGTQTRVVGYDGELRDGMVSSFLTIPGSGLVVAVTSNTSYADTAAIALKIAEEFAR